MEVILCDLKHILNRILECNEMVFVHNFDQLRFPIDLEKAEEEELKEVVKKLQRQIAVLEGAVEAIKDAVIAE